MERDLLVDRTQDSFAIPALGSRATAMLIGICVPLASLITVFPLGILDHLIDYSSQLNRTPPFPRIA